MSRQWRVVLLVAFAIVAGAATVSTDTGPVWASCAVGPRESPYRFTGTVVQTSNAGRTATVRTEDGRTVVVKGSDAEGDNAATSVDRAYQVGVRYEFHPVNDASPYRDNICTATHPLDAQAPPPAGPTPQATPWWWVLGIAAVLLAAGIGSRSLRRATRRAARPADS